jgi:hypothetical protein
MKKFTWHYAALFSLSTVLFVAPSCSDESDPIVTAVDFETTMDENPESGTEIGDLEASTDKGTLNFTITSQSVAGAIAVNSVTGELTVADASKFDFETHPTLTAVVSAKSEGTEKPVNVTINLQKVIWEGANLTFTKASGADWKLAGNQDKITDLVSLTRQNKGPLYNYQWWQDVFESDATFNDLSDDFWNNNDSERDFVRAGGTIGIRWAILDNTGASDNEAWGSFDLYGTPGDPTHYYSFHNIASILTDLEDNTAVIGVVDDFSHENSGGIDDNASTQMDLLEGKKLGVWLVEEDIYFTLTFTEWGIDGANTLSYIRSTKD